jgi:hypothetical protein
VSDHFNKNPENQMTYAEEAQREAEGVVNKFTYLELRHLLDCLRQIHGPGYAQDAEVARLQSKLSIALEVSGRTIPPGEKEQLIAMPAARRLAAKMVADQAVPLMEHSENCNCPRCR